MCPALVPTLRHFSIVLRLRIPSVDSPDFFRAWLEVSSPASDIPDIYPLELDLPDFPDSPDISVCWLELFSPHGDSGILIGAGSSALRLFGTSAGDVFHLRSLPFAILLQYYLAKPGLDPGFLDVLPEVKTSVDSTSVFLGVMFLGVCFSVPPLQSPNRLVPDHKTVPLRQSDFAPASSSASSELFRPPSGGLLESSGSFLGENCFGPDKHSTYTGFLYWGLVP
ncbi:hypothetical protein K438DRAFT_1993321 [Mycena galopus ATCC 62051]|nr:hypothetical protein K438DRAFT_1993321 [Mycena galopus ATCC 62051]